MQERLCSSVMVQKKLTGFLLLCLVLIALLFCTLHTNARKISFFYKVQIHDWRDKILDLVFLILKCLNLFLMPQVGVNIMWQWVFTIPPNYLFTTKKQETLRCLKIKNIYDHEF